MIEVAARLPFMSDRDLSRVFGDHLGKITLGFEVEVAVEPEAAERLPMDEDAVRARFLATYENPITFGTWLSGVAYNNAANVFSEYEIAPRFGWSRDVAAMGPETENFWRLVGAPPLDGDDLTPRELRTNALEDRARALLVPDTFKETDFGGILRYSLGDGAPDTFVNQFCAATQTLAVWIRRHRGTRPAVRVQQVMRRLADLQMVRVPEASQIIHGLGETTKSITDNLAGQDDDGSETAQFVADIIYIFETAFGVLTEFAYANHDFLNADVAGRTSITAARVFESIVDPSDIMDHRHIRVTADGMKRMVREWTVAADRQRETDTVAHINEILEGVHNAKINAVEHVAEIFARTQPGTTFKSGHYHSSGKSVAFTRIEADDSISPMGAEIVGPAAPLARSLPWLADQFKMIETEATLTTNDSTGLHANIGTWRHEYRTQGKLGVLPGSIDVLKLLVFVGDRAHLAAFGRLKNRYTKPMLESVRRSLAAQRVGGGDELAINRYIEQANLSLISDASINRQMAVNLQNLRPHGYIEFRIMGGTDYHLRYADVRRTTMRFAQVCMAAADPALYRRQYLIGLYKAMMHANPVFQNLQDKTYRPIFRAFLVKNAPALLAATPALHEDGVSVNHVPQLVEEALRYDAYGSQLSPLEKETLGDYLTGLALVLDAHASGKMKATMWRYALQGLGWHADSALVDQRRIDLRTRDWAQEAENGVL